MKIDILLPTELLLSAVCAFALRQLRDSSGQSLAAVAQKVVAKMAWVLLAVFSIEAMSKGRFNIIYILIMLTYILVVLGLAMLFTRNRHPGFQLIPVAATTFGGGNRGVALISAITTLPTLLPYQNEIMAAFIQLDSAVILWLIAVVPYLLAKSHKDKPKITDSLKTFVSEAGYAPIVIVFVVIIGAIIPKAPIYIFIQDSLADSTKIRGAILTYLAFTLMFMSFRLTSRTIGEVLSALFEFYTPRLLVPLIGVFIAFQLHNQSALYLEAGTLAFGVALLVMALCPPSSLLSVMLATNGHNDKQTAELSDLNIVATFLFLIMVIAIPIFQ